MSKLIKSLRVDRSKTGDTGRGFVPDPWNSCLYLISGELGCGAGEFTALVIISPLLIGDVENALDATLGVVGCDAEEDRCLADGQM